MVSGSWVQSRVHAGVRSCCSWGAPACRCPPGLWGHPWVQDGWVPPGPGSRSRPHMALVPVGAQRQARQRHVELCQPLRHPELAKPAWLRQGHPPRLRGPGAGWPPRFGPTTERLWPRVVWHCHTDVGTATCPPALSPQLWHGHQHMSPGIMVPPMVAPPRPHVPWHHCTHGGMATATCPLALPHCPGVTGAR